MAKLQRKATPFLQAMSDIRYCALKQRNDIIFNELFKNHSDEFKHKMNNRFNQKDVWAPY